jgi:hypothetical protein
MDDNASGVEEDDNPGNYQPWSEFMTETVEDGVYLIHQNLEVGDGSTATTLTSLNEMVWFDDNKHFTVKNVAVLTLGELHNSWGRNGSYWSVSASTSYDLVDHAGGTLNLYDSKLECKSTSTWTYAIVDGIFNSYNSTICGNHNDNTDISAHFSFSSSATPTLYDTQFKNLENLQLQCAVTGDDVRVHDVRTVACNVATAFMSDALITDITVGVTINVNWEANWIFRNPKATIENEISTTLAGRGILEDYSVNIKVKDGDGNALENALVKIEDDQSDVVCTNVATATLNERIDTDSETAIDVTDGSEFSAGEVIRIGWEYMQISSIASNTLTVTRAHYTNYVAQLNSPDQNIYVVQQNGVLTDASGDIEIQYLPYKYWHSTSETEVNPNPYTITISKSGYETLIMENITIDSKLDFHQELHPAHGPFLQRMFR